MRGPGRQLRLGGPATAKVPGFRPPVEEPLWRFEAGSGLTRVSESWAEFVEQLG
jgi:hypothetical protein